MQVVGFVARRAALGLASILAATALVFVLTQVLGDPAVAVLGRDAQQPEVLAAKRAELGLDRSLPAQYGDWLRGALTGDLGTSYVTGRAVLPDVAERAGNSLFLMGLAAVVALPLALVVGVQAARRRDRAFDHATNVATLALASVPEFVVATVLVVVFAVGVFEVLPAVSSVRGATRPWHDLAGLVLPVVTLVAIAVPYSARSVRTSMSEVLDSEYVEMARLNGVDERSVVWRHALPNALAPTLQVAALSLAFMAGGVVVVESVFAYPGIGSALVESISNHDVPVVQAIALFLTAFYVTLNAAADLGVVLFTPRLRTALQ